MVSTTDQYSTLFLSWCPTCRNSLILVLLSPLHQSRLTKGLAILTTRQGKLPLQPYTTRIGQCFPTFRGHFSSHRPALQDKETILLTQSTRLRRCSFCFLLPLSFLHKVVMSLCNYLYHIV